ncbi:MAG: hypothetical protein WAT36_01845 [Chromatiaceae bacterium]
MPKATRPVSWALPLGGLKGWVATPPRFGTLNNLLGPSNVTLHKVGARRWIARIMMTWGLVSLAIMWVMTVEMFYLPRFPRFPPSIYLEPLLGRGVISLAALLRLCPWARGSLRLQPSR